MSETWERMALRDDCRACGQKPLLVRGASGRKVLMHDCPVLGGKWLHPMRGASGIQRAVEGWNRIQSSDDAAGEGMGGRG